MSTKISLSMTLRDSTGKKSSKSITSLSETATDAQIAAFARALVDTTTTSLEQLDRVEKRSVSITS